MAYLVRNIMLNGRASSSSEQKRCLTDYYDKASGGTPVSSRELQITASCRCDPPAVRWRPGRVYAGGSTLYDSIILCATHDVIRGYRMLAVTAASVFAGVCGRSPWSVKRDENHQGYPAARILRAGFAGEPSAGLPGALPSRTRRPPGSRYASLGSASVGFPEGSSLTVVRVARSFTHPRGSLCHLQMLTQGRQCVGGKPF
jgi:hypothetical protein